MKSWKLATEQHKANCLARRVHKPCLNCSIDISIKPAYAERTKYCSRKCMFDHRRKETQAIKKLGDLSKSLGQKPRRGVVQVCICGKEFYKRPGHTTKYNKGFCSKVCHNKSLLKGKPLACRICNATYYRSPSQIKWRGTGYCSSVCKGKGITLFRTGENSPSWKGGISSENRRIRSSKQWRDWRKQVFERDDYTCQGCHKRGGYLEPHHLLRFYRYPEYRFLVANGQTLCRDCHQLTKKYDRLPIRKEDLEIFYAQN